MVVMRYTMTMGSGNMSCIFMLRRVSMNHAALNNLWITVEMVGIMLSRFNNFMGSNWLVVVGSCSCGCPMPANLTHSSCDT